MPRVVAAEALPAGARTPTLATEELRALVCAGTQHEQILYLRAEPPAHTLPAWCVRARLAPHVAACSLVLSRAAADRWRAECRGGARTGGELRVWFAPDLLAAVRMPFLTPRNIRGKKNYTCHECAAQFEDPNPLKLHLFLACKPYSGERFWREFLRRCDEPPATPAPPATLAPAWTPPPPTTELSRPWECGGDVSALVARRGDVTLHWDATDAAVDLLGRAHATLTPHWTGEATCGAWGAAAEALAAAWSRGGGGAGGAGGGGHRCVYCGRRYSRAYGLKIHVRTHTGYKPLRCPVCARPFGDPSNLNKHVRLHARHATHEGGGGRHACAACGKLLARRRDLERHVRTRHAHLLAGGSAGAAKLEV